MYGSLEEIVRIAQEDGKPLWEVVLEEDCKESALSREDSLARMGAMWQAMKDSDAEYDPELRSASGMVGTDAAKLAARKEAGQLLSGGFVSSVSVRALKIAESNACMKRIVASPTAGSCGVVPACLITAQEKLGLSDQKMVEALYVSAGIGGVIAIRASLSGAEGGCQAEIGSASAMAAGALAYLQGGSPDEVCHAAALALKGLLGLVCDPVAGLVEVPCVKRNVIGSVNAVTSADMAMAGIRSKIPADQVFDAMRSIGRTMPSDLRETGKGGLAATPAGVQMASCCGSCMA
ncbi:MAG: L-serine ammonia-lyase, iron-sulfur-dependent, subunit alpha [Coriobacteriia bacterium]|nr:L-serine ammonia-lyase, iron-sulfur-dependent, subunit alpha [Coriobacteriia bacterium]